MLPLKVSLSQPPSKCVLADSYLCHPEQDDHQGSVWSVHGLCMVMASTLNSPAVCNIRMLMALAEFCHGQFSSHEISVCQNQSKETISHIYSWRTYTRRLSVAIAQPFPKTKPRLDFTANMPSSPVAQCSLSFTAHPTEARLWCQGFLSHRHALQASVG